MDRENIKEVFETMEKDKNLDNFPEYMESIKNIWGWQWTSIAFGLITLFQINKRLINALNKSSKSSNFLARVWIWATLILSGVWIRITIKLSQ